MEERYRAAGSVRSMAIEIRDAPSMSISLQNRAGGYVSSSGTPIHAKSVIADLKHVKVVNLTEAFSKFVAIENCRDGRRRLTVT